jgi:hypothetical protein
MVLENLQNLEFKNIMQEHIYKVVEYLLDESEEFGVACDIEYVDFNPALPDDIQKTLPNITLFMLANYTLESAFIDKNKYLKFEAGFGAENIGAIVTIPLLAIKQIFVGEYPILINIAEPIKDGEDSGDIDSMSILLNNPENAKLLKNRGKRD